jgi:hypothetical protein
MSVTALPLPVSVTPTRAQALMTLEQVTAWRNH